MMDLEQLNFAAPGTGRILGLACAGDDIFSSSGDPLPIMNSSNLILISGLFFWEYKFFCWWKSPAMGVVLAYYY